VCETSALVRLHVGCMVVEGSSEGPACQTLETRQGGHTGILHHFIVHHVSHPYNRLELYRSDLSIKADVGFPDCFLQVHATPR